jgi:beta-xylosidase
VIRGDFPDPSIIRVGEDYWATATTSEWAPLFPLLHSRDLVHWQIEGAVFEKRPDWSNGNYWAPEIQEFNGKFFVYSVGHKKDGPLSIGVSTADKPLGPWTDHGPMIGQEVGSIDPIAVNDENGVRYLIWKEDGNSRNRPTPIWAQKLSADGTKLVGEMKELIRNDVPWEGNLVEGPFVLRRGEYFYMFYSGAGCCGRGCTYGMGVARAKKLLGPWEKYSGNPIVANNEKLKCPGHGSLVTDPRGKTFLLYHAYDTKDFVYVGRQGVLDEVNWNADGWPVINGNRGPSVEALAPLKFAGPGMPSDIYDDFTAKKLGLRWQWPQPVTPVYTMEGNGLVLKESPDHPDASLSSVVALQTSTGNYSATTCIELETIKAGTSAGLYAFGDTNRALGIRIQDGSVSVLRRHDKRKEEVIGTTKLASGKIVHLRLTATDGHKFRFSFWNETKWTDIGGDMDVEGDFLPPWDRGIRVAIAVGGTGAATRFDWIKMLNKN